MNSEGLEMDDLLVPVVDCLQKAERCFADGRAWRAVQFGSLALEGLIAHAPHHGLDAGILARKTVTALGVGTPATKFDTLQDELRRTLLMLGAYGENAATLFGLASTGQSLIEALDTQPVIPATERSAIGTATAEQILACAGTHLRLKHRALLMHYERKLARDHDAVLQEIEEEIGSGRLDLPGAISRYGPALAYLCMGRLQAPQEMNASTRITNAAAMLNAVKADAAVLFVDGERRALGDYDALLDVDADDSREIIEPLVIDRGTGHATYYRLQVLPTLIGPAPEAITAHFASTATVDIGIVARRQPLQ